MKKRLLPILVSLVILLPLLTPLPSEALSLVPCGNTENPVPCTLCHIVSGIASLIGYIRDIMVFIALAVITAMGVLYIVSSGNQGTMETAKKGIFASLIGIAVILSAWLIVNTVMFTVFQAKSDLGVGASFSVSNGFSFACPGSGSSATPATAPTPVASSIPAGGTLTIPAGSVATFSAATTVTVPSAATLTQSNGTQTAIPAGTTTGVPAGSTLSFPSGTQATLTFTQKGDVTVSAQKPDSCTITASPASPAIGGSVELKASCMGGVPTSYAWTGDCVPSNDRCVKNGLAAGQQTYTLIATNATGSSNKASLTLNPGSAAASTYALTVTKEGDGTVTGDGISCGNDCKETYSQDKSVNLSVVIPAGNTFASWGGACSGNASTCTITMNEAKSVTASFIKTPAAGTALLTVGKDGTGTGTVTGTGINCGNDCSETYSGNPDITLKAVPGANSKFDGWFGACFPGVDCTVAMTGGRNVTASFSSTVYTLSVSVSGTGSVSGPGGISCPGICSVKLPAGTPATLTASKTPVSWSGSCAGNASTCIVSETNAGSVKSVSVAFSDAAGGNGVGVGGGVCARVAKKDVTIIYTKVPSEFYPKTEFVTDRPDMAYAFKFKTGKGTELMSGSIAATKMTQGTGKYVMITRCPGDATPVTPKCYKYSVESTHFNFFVNAGAGVSGDKYCLLAPDTEYYAKVFHSLPGATYLCGEPGKPNCNFSVVLSASPGK